MVGAVQLPLFEEQLEQYEKNSADLPERPRAVYDDVVAADRPALYAS